MGLKPGILVIFLRFYRPPTNSLQSQRKQLLPPVTDPVDASNKTALNFLMKRLQGAPDRMGYIDCAEQDAGGCPANRRKPPRLNTQWGRAPHFLSASLEIPGFVVLNAGLYLCRRLHDGQGKRPSVRASPNRGHD